MSEHRPSLNLRQQRHRGRGVALACLELRRELEMLERNLTRSIETLDTFEPLAGGLDDEDLAALTLQLDGVREKAKRAVTRMTAVRDAVADRFCQVLAEKHDGKWRHEALGATFSGKVRCFAAPPSQLKKPKEFEELLEWLRSNGHSGIIDVGTNGRYSLDKFDELCMALLEQGKPAPPHVGTHLVAIVDVRKQR